MFPTTIWTTIRQAGALDEGALEDFARRYRSPVLDYIQGRGFEGNDAEDLCHEVFLRVFEGRVLTKADSDRGNFRSLLLAVTKHAIQDRLRERKEIPVEDLEVVERQPDFDQTWALHLAQRAMASLREQGSSYYEVLEKHLSGERQNRNKLWIARRKLATLIRREVAFTCLSQRDFEEELAYLSQYLRASERPSKKE